MKQLHVSETVALPIEAVTSTIAVLGKKGSGKTYTAKKLAELMLDSGFQVVILDIVGVWWGLKSSADGKSAGYSIPIFGGKRPDIPLEPTAGEVTARAIVEGGFSCIVDIGQFSKTKRHQFAAAFLEELYQRNEHAMHLMVDEADFYAPQKPISPQASICLGAMDELVRRGRQRGIGVSLITQRPQVLNKDVLTQADLLIALRLNHPLDIKSVMEWVKVKADAKEAQVMLDSLPGLPTGDFWAWAPELELFARGKADPAKTFDSSATPKPGQRRTAPKVLADIDIAKLGERIAATVEEQKANDPAALKARIRELERVAAKPVTVVTDKSGETELRQMLMAEQAANKSLNQRLVTAWKELGRLHALVAIDVAGGMRTALGRLEEADFKMGGLLKLLDPSKIPAEEKPLPSAPVAAPPLKMIRPFDHESSSANMKTVADSIKAEGINGPKQQILNAIATFKHANVPARPAYIAGFCGTTVRARGFEENIRQLRKDGMVTTANGVFDSNGYGHPSDLGSGWAALRTVLSDPQYKMLQAVRDTPHVTAESLAEFMGTTVRARGFEENLRRLRADELLTGGKDALAVAEWLR